jgi:hypothetical protein
MHTFRPRNSLQFARYCMAVGTLSGVSMLGMGGQAAWADTVCTPPTNGPATPDASTFTYQCSGTYAGDWTNSYYAYSPATSTQTPLYSPDYSYDCTTNTWTEAEWSYDTTSGTYVENRVPAATPPMNQGADCAIAQNSNASDENTGSGGTTTAPIPSTSGSSTDTTTAPAATAPPDPNVACPTPAGTTPDTTAPQDHANSSVTMNNEVCSGSQSGNASVTNNGTAGNATSGDATTEVDVANLVDTLSDTLGSGETTFTVTIDKTINGDFVLDPSTIMASAGSNSQQPNAIDAVTTDAAINNDVTASAVTGDATVSGNGDGGNALTGDAEAIVNLINMINSAVAAGHSFIGTINITGDLNGNILIPQSVIDQILASNASTSGGADNSNTALNNNESITNNVTASATSGNASVTNNGTAGNATSGDASTNITIMNLTGSSIVGQNVLLVFVNVLGHWVGMIVNAPAGATSAEFGGGITSDTPGTGESNAVANANLSITNNVTASATSGNASVADNRTGGNATSGHASTAVNILNVEESTLSVANWFGILFINVFGTWNGNFGIYAPLAPTVSSNTSPSADGIATNALEAVQYSAPTRHFATFTPTTSGDSTTIGTVSSANAAVLGDAIVTPTAKKLQGSSLSTTNSGAHTNYTLPALGFFAAALLLAASERNRLFRRNK